MARSHGSSAAHLPPSFRCTTELLAPFAAFFAPQSHKLYSSGLPLGTDDRGDTFLFDPYELKRKGVINALVFMVIGEIGYGKTSLVKSLALSMALFRSLDDRTIRISIDDHKLNRGVPEYQRLVVEGFGGEEKDLSTAELNLFDPRMGLDIGEQLAIIQDTVRHIKKRSGGSDILSNEETTAIRAALVRLHDLQEEDQTLESFLDILNKPNELKPTLQSGAPMHIDRTRFRDACSSLVQVLSRLYGGDYGTMFAGRESLADYMSQPIVAFDYTRVDPEALTLIQALIWRWKTAAQRRQDARFMVDLMIGDENHEMWKHPVYADAMYSYIKKVRTTGGMVIMNTHHVSDYDALGSDLASNMVRDVTGWFIGRTKHEEALNLQRRFKFSDTLRRRIETLGVGQFVFFVEGQPPVTFQVELNEFEMAICESDQATNEMFA